LTKDYLKAKTQDMWGEHPHTTRKKRTLVQNREKRKTDPEWGVGSGALNLIQSAELIRASPGGEKQKEENLGSTKRRIIGTGFRGGVPKLGRSRSGIFVRYVSAKTTGSQSSLNQAVRKEGIE